MSQSDAFDRVVASLNAATLDDVLWPSTAAVMDEACGLTGNDLLARMHHRFRISLGVSFG